MAPLLVHEIEVLDLTVVIRDTVQSGCWTVRGDARRVVLFVERPVYFDGVAN